MTEFTKPLILSAWILMLVVILLVIGANLYMMLRGLHDDTLENWGSMSLVFLFGGFIAMVRDALHLPDAKKGNTE